MNHLKKLGLMALALTAVMAVAGVASASASQFTASATGILISGGQTTEHVISVEGSEWGCEDVELTGETEATSSSTQALHPAYSGCVAFGFQQAVVDTSGCEFVFDAAGGMSLQGCTNGYMSIEIESIFNTHCLVRFGDYDPEEEAGVNGAIDNVGYADNEDGTVTASFAANNIHYEVLISTGFCPLSEGSGDTAGYTGSTILTPSSGSFGFDE